jgi:glycosyltransferase involved in cell wall biosynthesis
MASKPMYLHLATSISPAMYLEYRKDANVLLFAADSVTNRRKGFHVLTEALNTLPDSSNIALVSVGAGNVKLGHGIPHIHVGHVEDRQRLSLVYSAADVYVAPSLQDNQPNTVLESMACGTPVVDLTLAGFRIWSGLELPGYWRPWVMLAGFGPRFFRYSNTGRPERRSGPPVVAS